MHALGSMFSDLLQRYIIVPSMKRENSVRFPMNQGKYPSKREHLLLTRRERLKSALYLRLKKRKVFKKGLFESPVCCKKNQKRGPLQQKINKIIGTCKNYATTSCTKFLLKPIKVN